MEHPIPISVTKPRLVFPVWGVILVILGALFLAAQQGHVHLGTAVLRWWPVLLVSIGATQMVNERRVLSPGITLVLIGGFALFFTLGGLRWKMLWKIWPVVLLVVGLSMLVGARRKV